MHPPERLGSMLIVVWKNQFCGNSIDRVFLKKLVVNFGNMIQDNCQKIVPMVVKKYTSELYFSVSSMLNYFLV